MKKVILLFFLFLFSISGGVNFTSSKEIVPAAVNIENADYIYVKVEINGVKYVYVYLSDGYTLIFVYEEED